jgi:hypothetical protein
MRARLIVGLCLLAAPVSADPQVKQRAFEEIPTGVFVRGGSSTVINIDPRCSEGCPEHQICQSVCEDRTCAEDAAPGTACIACRWRCSSD